MKIYLAGPDVFLPDAVEIGRQKAAICGRYGLTGLYPLDNAIDLTSPDASRQIFCGNEAMMDDADAIIANLTRSGCRRRPRHRLRARLHGRPPQVLPGLFQTTAPSMPTASAASWT
ncbi:nucleoside 2-deoxyribosyltransferase [Bradyrhizobium japonicum]